MIASKEQRAMLAKLAREHGGITWYNETDEDQGYNHRALDFATPEQRAAFTNAVCASGLFSNYSFDNVPGVYVFTLYFEFKI
jgi:hypothetical protein